MQNSYVPSPPVHPGVPSRDADTASSTRVTETSSRRPSLLFLCQTLPFPPRTGVTIRTFNVLRLLARSYEITALCFYRRSSKASRDEVVEAVAQLRQYASVEAFPIPQEHNRIRLFSDHLASLVSGRPYTYFAYSSTAFRRRLQELLDARTFALVHVDSLDLSAYLPLLNGLPVVAVHHNIESNLLRRRSEAERGILRRVYIAHQARLTEREELRWCADVALNVVVSDADSNALRTLVPHVRVVVAPNGVDTSALKPALPSRVNARRLVFVGGHGWFPNADALAYFCSDILPRIRAVHPDVEVHWVGKAPPDIIREYSKRYSINVTGFVEDMVAEVAPAACYVVPIRVGGGTRLKILDAWALGKAVVSTSIGCEGLDARHEQNILIADSADAFADAVHRVLTDPELRLTLETNARTLAVQRYDWQVIGRRMIAAYQALLSDR